VGMVVVGVVVVVSSSATAVPAPASSSPATASALKSVLMLPHVSWFLPGHHLAGTSVAAVTGP